MALLGIVRSLCNNPLTEENHGEKTKKKPLDLSLPIYQLKIGLEHIDPSIWRRVQTDDCSLADLHEIIQVAMGWEDQHMHAFVIDDEEYGDSRRGGDCEYDSRFVRLSDVVEQGHTRFRYDYDFGDDWEHFIEIETTLPAEKALSILAASRGNAPARPKTAAAPTGYPDFLDKMQDPNARRT